MKKILFSKWKILAPVVMVLAFLLTLAPAVLADPGPMKLKVCDVVNDTPVVGSRVESYLLGWKTIGYTDANGELFWTWSGNPLFRFYPPVSEAGKYVEQKITFADGGTVQINLSKINFHLYDAANHNDVGGSLVKPYGYSGDYTDANGIFDFWMPDGQLNFQFYPPGSEAGRCAEKLLKVNDSLTNPVEVNLNKVVVYVKANGKALSGAEVQEYYDGWNTVGTTGSSGTLYYWMPNGAPLFKVGSGNIWFQSTKYPQVPKSITVNLAVTWTSQ